MASVQELADGLARACHEIRGLHCYGYDPPDPQVPSLVVNGPIRWTYDETMEVVDDDGMVRRYWRPVFELVVDVNAADSHGAQLQLHAYMAPSGTKSLLAALYGDPTLGGVADSIKVLGGIRPPTVVDVAGVKHLSCSLEVEVLAV